MIVISLILYVIKGEGGEEEDGLVMMVIQRLDPCCPKNCFLRTMISMAVVITALHIYVNIDYSILAELSNLSLKMFFLCL